MATMSREEALDYIKKSGDHSVWEPVKAVDIAIALGFPAADVPIHEERDTRNEFKGLTLYGINPKTGEEFKEGDTTEIVDPLDFLSSMCSYFNIEYPVFIGRGFQHRELVRALVAHFESGESGGR